MSQGWNLTLVSSALCICGCLVVFLDDLYTFVFPGFITRRFPFHLKENYGFMNASLAFSSGCLLFTALYRLLPEALLYLEDSHRANGESSESSAWVFLSTRKQVNVKMFVAYIGGIALSLAFNAVLHIATSESVFHCSEHGGEGPQETVTASDLPDQTEVSEESPLMPTLSRKKSLFHLLKGSNEGECIEGECKGYSSAELCLLHGTKRTSELHHCEIPALSPNPEESDGSDDAIGGVTAAKSYSLSQCDHNEHSHNHSHIRNDHHTHSLTDDGHESHHHQSHQHHLHDHHHHVNSPFSRLFLIGIQTILAITLHKFPEGFITYLTSATDPELGVLIFIGLLFHNFTEGFLMCLPLYYLFASSRKPFAKLKAVAISGFLGGVSQPLGATGAILFLKLNNATPGDGNLDVDKLNHILGLTLAVTSGFLSVIGLSMYGSAVSFSGGTLQLIMVWCLVGMAVIGCSSVITMAE